MAETIQIKSKCHTCDIRARAEQKPHTLFARLWRWHIGWCPGWKAYAKELKSKGLEVPKP